MNDGHVTHDPSTTESAPLGLMAALKERTSGHHAAIERVVPLLDPDFDRARYVTYLRVMYRFHRQVEGALVDLDDLREALPDFDERRKVALLARDLDALGAGIPLDASNGIGLSLRSVAQGLGALYVIEGSTLGGRILSRHLTQTLGVAPSDGGAYLASYGERLSVMWRRFGAALEAWSRGRDPAPVLDSACATFSCLGDLFTGVRAR